MRFACPVSPGSTPLRPRTPRFPILNPAYKFPKSPNTNMCLSINNNTGSFKNFELKTLENIKEGTLGEFPKEDFLWEVGNAPLDLLTAAAASVRDRRADANVITFSPKVFIPLTRACRDFCGYCTFALPPRPGQAIYMKLDEVLEIAHQGAKAGCTEALFTLGDKPELLYPPAMEEARNCQIL